MLRVVHGAPGTGKTRYCLGVVEEALAAGTSPQRIAYVSFTRAAIDEAKQRAARDFGLDPEEDLPWFRTLHSLALRAIGSSASELLDRKAYRELGDLLGEDLRGHDSLDEDGEPRARKPAATALFLDQLARATDRSLEDCYQDLPFGDRPRWPLVRRAAEAYQLYKSRAGALDFTDLLEHAAEEAPALGLDLVVIDEAQDLSPLQWRVAERVLLSRAERVVVVGDPNQALFRWAGADPQRLLDLRGERHVLPHSHRVPRSHHRIAQALAHRIGDRPIDDVLPRNAEGRVEVIGRADALPVRHGEDWLVLARHGRHVRRLAKELRARGVPYVTRTGRGLSWEHARAINAHRLLYHGRWLTADYAQPLLKLHGLRLDREMVGPDDVPGTDRPWDEALPLDPAMRAYARALLDQGIDPTAEPTVRLSTIHGAKGAEADHVVLDVALSARTTDALQRDPAGEHRAFFVGATRARERLVVLDEGRRERYPLPLR